MLDHQHQQGQAADVATAATRLLELGVGRATALKHQARAFLSLERWDEALAAAQAWRATGSAGANEGRSARTRVGVSLIDSAIERGAPLFNDGRPDACQAVYEVTVICLLALGEDLFEPAVAEQLNAALTRPEGPQWATDHAWILRRAMDAAYAGLR